MKTEKFNITFIENEIVIVEKPIGNSIVMKRKILNKRIYWEYYSKQFKTTREYTDEYSKFFNDLERAYHIYIRESKLKRILNGN